MHVHEYNAKYTALENENEKNQKQKKQYKTVLINETKKKTVNIVDNFSFI